jgi:F420-0:gamma-glutamyl ligase-like protein
MKHMTKYFGLLFLTTLLGCAESPESASMKMADEEIVTPTSGQKADEVVERKLIKEGQVEFETDNLSSTRKNIFEAVTKYKGYVSSDQEFKSPGRKSNTVIIRVPADNFDN